MGLISIVSDLLGIGKTAADRLIPDKNAEAQNAHEERDKQIDATSAGQSAPWFSPRNFVLLAVTAPVALQFGAKPVIEWGFALAGHPRTLPNIDVAAPLKILLGLLGLNLS